MKRTNQQRKVAKAFGTVGFVGVCCALSACASSQEFAERDRARVQRMLRDVSTDVKEHYYDVHFHGVDWDARVAKAQDEIAKASSLNMAMSHVAAALDSLNDSHTFFLPPMRPYRHDYGFLLQMIGDRCFVIRVHPRSDAEAKGVKPGDELLAINGFGLSRNSLWKVEYVFNSLRPQPGLRLILKDLSGAERQVDVLAQIEQIVGGGRYGTEDAGDLARQDEDARHRNRARAIAVGHDIGVLKLPVFEFSASNVADMMEEMRAYKSLVLDLRGNPGGAIDTLKAFVSSLFRKDVKIGDRVGRDKTEPMIAKAVRQDPFEGALVVLVDSRSASSSEILARVVQLEKRGAVMGDRSSGSVMEALSFTHHVGVGTVVFFGVSVTDANLIMIDGKSLEHGGVVPDEIVLPTAADLAEGRDPVLAHAIETLGGRISPQNAGNLFPFEWPTR